MSHFSLLVITNEEPTNETLKHTLQPFHEFECTGADDQYVQTIDVTKDALDSYNRSTTRMVRMPDGGLVDAYDERFYREPTPEEAAHINSHRGATREFSYDSRDWEDGLGYRPKVRQFPDGSEEVDLPVIQVTPFAQWAADYYEYHVVQSVLDLDTKDRDKYGYILANDNGSYSVFKRTNPNRKWDWWQIGGRWTGAYAHGYDPAKDPRNIEECNLCGGTGRRDDKIAKEHRLTDPSYTCNGCDGKGVSVKWPTQWARVPSDSTQRKNINVQAIRDEAATKAGERWDAFYALASNTTWTPWRELTANSASWTGEEWAAARESYRAQSIHKLVAPLALFEIDPYLCSRDEYVTRARDKATTLFAVLKDGIWYERGGMGWWGVVHDEKDEDTWNREFAALFDSMPPDTWVTVVDCHI